MNIGIGIVTKKYDIPLFVFTGLRVVLRNAKSIANDFSKLVDISGIGHFAKRRLET